MRALHPATAGVRRGRSNGQRIAAVVATLLASVSCAASARATITGMSALASANCSASRLTLVLDNQSATTQTFTITWPGRSGSPWARTISAGDNTTLFWTVPEGTPYNLTTTTPTGFSANATGSFGCDMGPSEPAMTATDLFVSGTQVSGLNGPNGPITGTVNTFRLPGMTVANDGTIVTVADARVANANDLPNNIQLVMRRSTDSGATWSAPEVIQHAPSTTEGTGDASLITDRTTGRIFCFFNLSPPGIGWASPASGTNSAADTKSLHVQYITSDDAGATWSQPADLNPTIKDASWQSLFAASGHGIETSTGRLIQPLVYRDAVGISHAADIYSDNHGATWHLGGAAGNDVNESKAIERSGGAIVQDMRANSPGVRMYASSTDGGLTFGPMMASILIDPSVNGDELSDLRPSDVDANGSPLTTATALFSNPANSTTRVNLRVRLSADDGATWPRSALLQPGVAGYSTMAILNDGTVSDLYEVGNTKLVFSRFRLGWLPTSSAR